MIINNKDDFLKLNKLGIGEVNVDYEPFFIGTSYLNLINRDGDFKICNVSFEPGCRNNWHIHHDAKQILICTLGEGWYQEFNKPPVRLEEGMVIEIPANVKHWHGASKDSWFCHIAFTLPDRNVETEWLEPVDDNYYRNLR